MFAFDQLNRIRGCMQIHRAIRIALEIACEIESIQIDSSIVWIKGQANPYATSGDIDRSRHGP